MSNEHCPYAFLNDQLKSDLEDLMKTLTTLIFLAV